MNENSDTVKILKSDKWLKASFYISIYVILFVFCVLPELMKPFYNEFRKLPELLKIFLSVYPPQLLILSCVPLASFLFPPPGRLLEQLNLSVWKFKYLKYAIAADIIIIPIAELLPNLLQIVLEYFNALPNDMSVPKLMKECSTEGFFMLAFAAVFLAPIGEELVFRHIIFNFLTKHLSVISAAVLTSLLFAGIHLNIIQFPALFLIGAALQTVYIRTKSLYVPILMHMLQNAGAVGFIFLDRYLNGTMQF